MIRSTHGRFARELLEGKTPKRLPSTILDRAKRKLAQLDAATNLDDLKVPPSNHLEKFVGNRQEQHSIRINLQWRVCFRWDNGDAFDVEIVDYH